MDTGTVAGRAGPGLDPASLEAWRALPAQRAITSSPASWRSVLVRRYREPEAAEEFTTAASGDLLLVVQEAGRYRLESRRAGRWAGADYVPGSMGLTAPGARSVLRWRPLEGAGPPGAQVATTLQVHLAAGLVAETARALGRPWEPGAGTGALELHAPGALATARALGVAAREGAPRLAADALAEALAAQLLAAVGGRARTAAAAAAADRTGRRRTRPLGAAQVRRVVEHLHAHLAEPVGLAECAALVGCSRAHFLRAFTAATGTTPHRYLVGLRLDRAAHLLRTTGTSVLDVAVACGWAGTSHFAEAFARRHGCTPTAYRRAHG
ncbi:helix-turn-helix domain-containing protein [Kineococcus terrestris]|uniref:helix-turn-helix domain-containing protein n=1 Tax=Kineococcus terrestris TaxID=2044856 RepID=UPI0034DAED53